MDWYRPVAECSGRGTANQSETRHHDVIQKAVTCVGEGGEVERRTMRDGEREACVSGLSDVEARHGAPSHPEEGIATSRRTPIRRQDISLFIPL